MRKLLLAVFSFFLVISSANAAPIWTTVGSAGTVDETALAIFAVDFASLGYSSSSSSTATITARYNVTIEDTNSPAWTTLEIVANDAGVVNGVTAILYGVSRSTGSSTLIAAVGSGGSGTNTTATGAIGTSTTFDFANNYYFVQASVVRTSSSSNPTLRGIRLY
jgi:hypothetical protein